MGDNASFRVLNISDILPNRFQPRIKFEDESLDELAESINRFGVIEPIVVRPIGNKFEIIAGERRYKASKLASKTTIPSIVISLSDKDSEELALLENVQRQSLNPIEEAVSYKRILDMGYITREELSKKIGKPQSVILNKTRLLNLADEVQSYLLNNKISERHARALLNITDLDDQVEMLHRIVNERLTVKKTNREIKKYLENMKDDDTETLFNSERGNEKMDIDKIMREAQDINTEANVANNAPDLMAAAGAAPQDNTQVFNSAPVNNGSVFPQEPGKFVNVQSEVGNAPSGAEVPSGNNTNGATFDNMFNGPINVQTPVNEPVSSSSEPVAPALQNSAQVPPTSINEEISNIVSDALKDQPIVNQTAVNTPTPLINDPVSIPSTEIEQPAVATPPIIDNTMINQNVMPQSNEIAPVQTTPSLDAPTINPQVNAGSTNNSFPASEEVSMNNNLETPPTPPAFDPVPQVNVSNNVPNYVGIVQKLREYADEIEKGGHFVNLEEVDLGNQYKVIFTFDK